MAETKKKTWLEVYLANYEGKTEEAKSVKEYLKENYKGNSYIPWATMERLTYMQDPWAVFEKVMTPTGGLVWTSTNMTAQRVISEGVTKQETNARMFGHFVKVKLTFMGKEFIEDYPIQDSSYEAVKAYDSNLINKALQRALAKVASRATGIGLKLYENKDLQFDEDTSKPKKPEIKKIEKVETKVKLTDEQKAVNILDGGETKAFLSGERTLEPQEVKVEKDEPLIEAAREVVAEMENEDINKLINLIKNTEEEKVTKVLQRLNPAILTKFSFTLNVNDSVEELVAKVSKFEDVKKFTKAIEVQLNNL